MKPYAMKHISPKELEIFSKIETVVNSLPNEIDLGFDERGKKVILSCHILARAIAKVFHLKYVDGYLYKEGGFEHGWIETDQFNIIDVYPIATVGGPIMIARNMFCCMHRPYQKARLKNRGFNKPWFRQAVKKTTVLLMTQLKLN